MKNWIFIINFTSICSSFLQAQVSEPVAPKVLKKLEMHGDTRSDPYYWLNDRKNTAVIDYLNAENAYSKAKMAPTEVFQKQLLDEIVRRIPQTDRSVPYQFNHYFYYTRFEAGKEYPYYCRKKDSLQAAEEIMLPTPELATGKKYYSIANWAVSPNNEQLCYGEDTVSRRLYTICFKNLKTGITAPTKIPNTTGMAVWANDNKTIFYTRQDTNTLRAYQIFRHLVGSNPADDDGNDFYITTNYQAKNFRLMKCSNSANTLKENWVEVIPHRPDVLLEGIEVFKQFVVISERKKGSQQCQNN